jgi:hypothetical protein
MGLRGRSLTSLATRAAYVGLAFALITCYWVLLRTRPQALLRDAKPSHGAEPTPPSDVTPAILTAVVSAVERAAELHPLRTHCLERALASRALLNVQGERARVVVGVSLDGRQLMAHAWVELDAQTNDASQANFVRLTRLS